MCFTLFFCWWIFSLCNYLNRQIFQTIPRSGCKTIIQSFFFLLFSFFFNPSILLFFSFFQEDGEHPATSEDESERQQRERDRQLRAEQSIKEREKEVQIQLAGHLRDRDKEREHHKRDEAMRHFSALLADLVRNADLTWKEVKKQLRKDHRWELVEQLEREDRERLFNDHIDQLSKKKLDKFREMLDEIPKLNLISAWKDIKKLIRDDPRYAKYNSSEKCEREFKDYIKDKTIEAKASFRELLQECKLITHKTLETVNENPGHMKEIEDILKNDKR